MSPQNIQLEKPAQLGTRGGHTQERIEKLLLKGLPLDLPGDPVVKNPLANAGDRGLAPGLGGSHMPRSNWAGMSQLLKPVYPRAHAPG